MVELVKGAPPSNDMGAMAELNKDDDGHLSTEPVKQPSESPPEVPVPYSVFSTRKKWLIVSLSMLSGFFSPISSNIYVPALPTLARDFNVSAEKMALTVTVFLIFQGITPSVWGSLADAKGRRPVYIVTLSLFVISCVGLAVTPTSSFGLLMFFRCLQATGGSAVIAIGAGGMADIASQRQRGIFLGLFQAGAQMGPAIGPVIGGAFMSSLGWRAIFWFLAISCGICLFTIILVFPETLRSIVGNGSVPPPLLNCTPAQIWQRRKGQPATATEDELKTLAPKKHFRPWGPLFMLGDPVIGSIFLYGASVYTEFYCNLTVWSTLMEDVYGISGIYGGLCYLPNGLGAFLATIINGTLQDWIFRRAKTKAGLDPMDNSMASVDFPLEKVRLTLIPWYFCIFHLSCIGMSWSVQAHAPLAVPMVLSFFVGYTGMANSACCSLFAVDMKPGQAGSVTASYNLVRCLLGAAGVSVIQVMVKRMGVGWAFVTISAISLLTIPGLIIIRVKGPRWRRERLQKH